MEAVRIAMWSGPRNISTAMMRSFGARADTFVVDEPLYAAYLHATGLDHPMRDAVLVSQSTDWKTVVASLLGAIPNGKAIYYQKHMTHHMLPHVGIEWMAKCRNAFLIRDPAAVLASYVVKRGDVTLDDIGIVRQCELFKDEADRLGKAPPVIDCEDVLADPTKTLSRLCTQLQIDFTTDMLHWPPGRRDTDGVWAPAWYNAVEQSTGFAVPRKDFVSKLADDLQCIADAARPYYESMLRYRQT
jgi:hypothetical protein